MCVYIKRRKSPMYNYEDIRRWISFLSLLVVVVFVINVISVLFDDLFYELNIVNLM